MKHLGMTLYHCVEGVRIQSYSGPHFLAFALNTERYGVSLHIKSEFGEIRNSFSIIFQVNKGHVNLSC